MSRRRRVAVAVAAAAAVLLLGRAAAGAYADYLWYAAAGAVSVWRAKTTTTLLLRVSATLIWSAFLFANIYAVRRSVVSLRIPPRQLGNLEISEEVPPRYLDAAAVILSLVLGALLGLPNSDWTGLLLARFGVPFGEPVTYFDELDLGFYVYWLPFETALRNTALVAILLAGAVVTFLYALTPSLTRQRGRLYVSRYVRRHLFALAAGLLLVLAWSYRLDAFNLLLDGSGPGGAFTYVDHRANIPVSITLSILSVSAAALVLWAGWTGQLKLVLIASSTLLVVAVALQQLAPVFARRSAPTQDAVRREQPYVNTRAQYTRRAYGADLIRPADSTSGFRSPADAASELSVWDPAMLVRALEHSRRGTGEPRAVGWQPTRAGLVALVPSGPSADSAPPPTWTVSHVLASANDQRGAPVGTGRDDPFVPSDVLVAPLLDEGARGYVILADSAGRIAAPALATRAARLAYAWALQNYGLLAGDLPQPTPRIVAERDPRTRLSRLVPFLRQGSTIIPVVDADTLYWVVELYATSPSYPLSARLAFRESEVGYVHHAATAVLNSRTGRLHLLADSASMLDPVARTWWYLFPDIFTTRGSLRPSLVRALPPPVDGIAAQAAAFAVAGSRTGGPRDGHLSRLSGADTTLPSGTPPMFASPAGSAVAWGVPVLRDDDRVLGLVVGTGGVASPTRWVPTAGEPHKYPDVLDRLRRATDTSASAPRGARLVRGVVQTVPVAGGLVFLQTTYAWQGDAPPAVAAVTAMLPDGTVRTARSLAEALGAGATPLPVTGGAPAGTTFEARVRALYQDMRSALARGDLAAFGAAYSALGELLDRGAAGPPPPPRRP